MDGSIERHKARFVARGFTQILGLDFDETFSPVISLTGLRILLALALLYNLEIHQLDVKTAYLNNEIDMVIYVEQPEGYDSIKYPQSKFVCLLKRGLYGLKQSGRLWNQTLILT